jgi:hypothetical protein
MWHKAQERRAVSSRPIQVPATTPGAQRGPCVPTRMSAMWPWYESNELLVSSTFFHQHFFQIVATFFKMMDNIFGVPTFFKNINFVNIFQKVVVTFFWNKTIFNVFYFNSTSPSQRHIGRPAS